jgi:hypothetical protein
MIKERTVAGMRRDVTGMPPGEFGGRGVQRVRLRDRNHVMSFARDGKATFPTPLEEFEDLVRCANTMHPEKLDDLRKEMDRLEEQWNELQDDDRASVAEWVESVCTPWLVARAPLRAGGLGPSWSTDFLIALLTDFDASSQVIDTVDRAWNRPSRSVSDVATTSRLAVAAGWVAWSHLIVDPELAESAVNVLGELVDRLDSMAHSGAAFTAADRGWTLAALALEERMVRHWLPGRGSVH